MLKKIPLVVAAAVVLLSMAGLLAGSAKASQGVCNLSSSRLNFPVRASSDTTLTLNNDESATIRWILISHPSSAFTITSAAASGWNASIDSDSTTILTGSSLPVGSSLDIHLGLQMGDYQPGEADWNIYTSDDPSAADGYLCIGSTPSFMADNIPHISNITTSNLSSRNITISWQSSSPASSRIDYGTTAGYGKSAAGGNQVVDHSLTLTGLTPSTVYHFRVSNTNGSASESSGDGTFLTPIVEKAPSASITTPVTNPQDKTPPTISITTSLPKVIKSIPAISGRAADDNSVVNIEYSLDGGHNWLPANRADGLKTKQVDFSFTPANLDDGNYNLIVRATDGGGNVAVTPTIHIVVDRLPPLVGGSVLSLGSQIMPSDNGVTAMVAGVDEKITLSAVGGPTSVVLSAKQKDDPKIHSFSLSQSSESGLWSGSLSFDKAGDYVLSADSVDGAGNQTHKVVGQVEVSSPAKALSSRDSRPVEAELTVYYLEPSTNSWVVWDGQAYGQSNPQSSGEDGSFRYYLPAGKYYLTASAKGFHTLNSQIFEMKQTSPLSTTLRLKPGHDWKIGPFGFSWLASPLKINPAGAAAKSKAAQGLIGHPAPNFTLSKTDGQTVNTVDLLGRPTDLVVMSTWAPSAAEQLSSIAKLQGHQAVNVVPLALQQNAAVVRAYDEIGGYSVNWIVDPDSSTGSSLGSLGMPTHYFINRDGIIKSVSSGVLSEQEILAKLSSL